jgi:transposase-like protein
MQTYHQNAKTNRHSRLDIKNSNLSVSELSEKHSVNKNTISKWKNSDSTFDKSSRPHNIQYKLSIFEEAIICFQRKIFWTPLDKLVDDLEQQMNESYARSTIYDCLVRNGLNQKPKDIVPIKLFKDYPPGFIHMDVTYLPKLDGIKLYLFVAIDRATRLLFYKVYEHRDAESAKDFLNECEKFFPFKIEKMLTDNGGEFINGEFEKLCEALEIEHRRTKPNTPKTNGMVEKANDIIKSNTLKTQIYLSREEMENDLNEFLLYYHTERRHGGLVKEKKGKTPMDAIRYWYNLDSSIFTISPELFILRLYFSILQRLQT